MLELLEIILLFVIQTGMTSFCMYFIALYSLPIFTYNVPTCNFSSTICYTCIHYTEMSFFVEMLSTCLEETFLPLFYFVNVKSVKGVPFFVKLGALVRCSEVWLEEIVVWRKQYIFNSYLNFA